MTDYWVALRKKRGGRFSQTSPKVFPLSAPDRETAKRTAQVRWPGYQVVFVEPLPKLLPPQLMVTQEAIRRGGYYIDADALADRFLTKVVYNEAVESYHRLSGEHERVATEIKDLRALNENPNMGQLFGALEDVYNDLSWHFAHEEMSGSLYRSISALGGHQDTLKKLHLDHLSILTSLECIITKTVIYMGEALEQYAEFAPPATDVFLAQLQRHEHQEHIFTESVLRC